MSKLTQQEQVLQLLRKAGNKGVPNYALYQHRILRPSARIGELREEGFNIYCEREYLQNGRATNVYRYYLIEEKKRWWKK